jgi:N-acetylglutamate synthase-like GNAT family acetyltransferase
MSDPSGVSIRHNMKPGDIGYITYLHGYLYFNEYGYDTSFEGYVAKPLSDFACSIKPRELIWILEKDEKIVGSMAIVEHSEHEAQLRWLLLQPDIRGRGLGKRLIDEAIAFCRAKKYRSIFLWTEDLLKPATGLYKAKGFVLTEEKTHELWGMVLTEQRYEIKLRYYPR